MDARDAYNEVLAATPSGGQDSRSADSTKLLYLLQRYLTGYVIGLHPPVKTFSLGND